ncbi:MAG: hypothetical protein ACTFAL_00415 [Candidatus Electronema sp. V4]|uniref:hypothetical protein n=1 Tax=Candidatus Electronema sp. V4 TaxID=3454756 RepID=UPI0040554175
MPGHGLAQAQSWCREPSLRLRVCSRTALRVKVNVLNAEAEYFITARGEVEKAEQHGPVLLRFSGGVNGPRIRFRSAPAGLNARH